MRSKKEKEKKKKIEGMPNMLILFCQFFEA